MVNASREPEGFKREMYVSQSEKTRESSIEIDNDDDEDVVSDEVQIVNLTAQREHAAQKQRDLETAQKVMSRLKESFVKAGGDVNEEAIVPLKSVSKRESDNAGIFDREAMLRAAQEEDDDEDNE